MTSNLKKLTNYQKSELNKLQRKISDWFTGVCQNLQCHEENDEQSIKIDLVVDGWVEESDEPFLRLFATEKNSESL